MFSAYTKAELEYERFLSEEPKCEEELLEEYEEKQDYLETEGDRLFEERRLEAYFGY